MEINVKAANPFELVCDGLIFGIFSDATELPGELTDLASPVRGKIKYLLEEKEITGKAGEITIIHTVNEIKPNRLVIAGMGKREDIDTNQLRESFSRAVKRMRAIAKHLVIIPPVTEKLEIEDTSCAIVEGILLGLYKFSKYLSDKEDKDEKEIDSITFAVPTGCDISLEDFERGIKYASTVCTNVNIAKDICNEPSNYMTPEIFSNHAKKLFEGREVKCIVLDEKEIGANNMNLLLAVGQGSKTPPRLVVLEYIKNKEYPTVGIVGKGITFDTGGVTLKQDKSTLFEMKRDLTGGAVALGIMKTIEDLKFPVNCVAVVPLAENAIGNASYKPGDIFYSMSGKSMEIFDTDCEGRLILADAFTYIQKYYSPGLIIDLATLLNLSAVIGDERIPFFTNSQHLVPKLEEASALSGEYIWQFPLDRRYRQRILSHYADRKNRSYKSPQTLAIALFLEDFIDKGVDWVHLDLAGVDTKYGETSYISRGSTAFGLRLITRFLFNLLGNYLLMK